MEALVGTAGWSYEDWVGPFYPERLPCGVSRLAFYSDFFDCVEVDSTFYRHFPPRVAEKWLGEVESNGRFVFLVKLHRNFTHGKQEDKRRLGDDRAVVHDFLRPFIERNKLGGVLVQFSEYFRDSRASRDRISSIADQFGGTQLFWELRHTSWYKDAAANFLRDHKMSLIAVDQPALKGMVGLNPEIPENVGYFRFHGRNETMWQVSRNAIRRNGASGATSAKDDPGRNDRYNYLYGGSELDEIEGKIRKTGERCERIYVVMNNHPMGKAVANALELVKRLRDQEKVRVPDTVIRYFPELQKIAERVRVGPEDSLFNNDPR